ncbi:MAG: aminotransferase class I/II-fold pyridoxal phosphate-dependent enzyme [Myxococcales bacterium]|nr:aminotransferase class I/II-fold pyridoxal phosphate-dependent enzyme [Myxococcales bacterium]
MHLIQSHQTRPSDDPIFALNKEATERRKKGESIVNATVGALLHDDGKLAVMPTAAKAVHDVPADEWAAYAPIAGSPDFLAAVMDDLFAGDARYRAQSVAVATPGGSGALRHALANFLEPGQAILTTNYYWGPYQTIADEAERRVDTFSMFNGSGAFDVEALDRALAAQLAKQGRALLFLNDPCQNPTGYSMRPEEWAAVATCLAQHAKKAPVTLLNDIAYAAYGESRLATVLDACAPLLGETAVLFAWSASKTFTHYGLRVGALVATIGDKAERGAVENALSYSSRGTWSNCTRGGQRAITHLLTNGDARAACARERDSLKAMLHARVAAFNREAALKGLRYPRYEGGFFVTVFHDDAKKKAERMREEGVYVVPLAGALRVGLCSVAEADVPRLVAALA